MSTIPVLVQPVRVDAIALFNKLNGEFVTVRSGLLTDADFNTDYYIGRQVKFNFTEQGDRIEGNLIINKDGTVVDNFKVVAFADRTQEVYESQLNTLASEKITKKYPITDQVNLLVEAILVLGDKHGLLETDEFDALTEMTEYIKYCLKVNKTKKEFFANDPNTNYISDADAAEALSRRYEGGIHEELGPRTINGGRVFS